MTHSVLARSRLATVSRVRTASWLSRACLAIALAGSTPESVAAQQPPARGDASPRDTLGFQHARHARLPCTDCHGASARRGSMSVRGPESCRSCHHKPDQAAPCVTCHAAAIRVVRPAQVTFRVAARRGSAVTRSLEFRHEQHARVDCAKCHGAGTDRAVAVTCTTCHADHHAADRNCATCHAGARGGHDRTVHDGCARCHASAPLPSMAASRPLCLTCHAAQRDHHPGGSCATCHAIAQVPVAGGARRP